MQVQSDVAISPGDLDHVRHQAGCDRHTGLVLLVRARIAEIGDHGRDTASRGSLQGVNEDQQLHEVVIGGRRCRLDDKRILSSNAGAQPDEQVAIGERNHLAWSQFQPQMVSYPRSQFR